MKPADLVKSKWMVAEDFGRDGIPKEPTATIDRITHQKMGKGDVWGVFHFREDWAKPLKANSTSRKACELMFGDRDTDDWLGKRLTFYAKPGNYPNGKKVAVRIKGSPDIKKAFTFTMSAFGGEVSYNLVPTGNVQLGPGVIRFGKDAGHYGKSFSDFDDEQLEQLAKTADAALADPKNAKEKWVANVAANVKEIREELGTRAKARQPAPDPEIPPEEGAPF